MSIGTISNGESGLSVRTKLNQVINVVNTGITGTDYYVTGGTYNNSTGTLTLNRQNGSVNVTGFVTGVTETQNLTNVLTLGNETGGNDIVISTGDKISDTTGDNIIEFTNVIPLGGILSTNSTPANPGPGAAYIISPNSTSGNGTGAQVRMIRNTSDNSFGIQLVLGNQNINPRGSGYEVGDTITFLGTQFGLSSPANDVTYTILSVTDEFNKINISSTDGTDTSAIDMSNISINFNVGDGNNYSSFYGNKAGISIGTNDDNNSIYTNIDFDPTLNNSGTRFYFDDANTGFYSSVELDPNGANNGNRLYTTDGSSTAYFQFDLSQSYISNTDGTTGSDIGLSTGGNISITAYDGVDTTTIEIQPSSLTLTGIQSFDDDTDAGSGGLTTGMLYQTTGLGTSPLDVAGILMIKQ
jgi:hypothetical protein